MVSIKWFGQACFEIAGSQTIVTDPHDGKQVGLKKPETKGDLITISHDHFDHSAGLDLVKGPDSRVMRNKKDRKIKSVKIREVDSYHDEEEGSKRGENRIYIMEIDEITICHLGDLGHPLSEEKVEEIGDVDVLMIPVGGNYTIDGEEAFEVMEDIEPSIVIPMHYKVSGLQVDISDDSEFIQKIMEEGYMVKKENIAEINEIPEDTEIIRLECQAVKREEK